MAKLIGLFRRKEGTSAAEFRDYYEQRHAPFALSHFGHLFASYTRNYVDPRPTGPADSQSRVVDAGIDVVTEIVFHDDAAMREMFAMSKRDPSLREAIAADEAAFMDRDANQILLASDHPSIQLERP